MVQLTDLQRRIAMKWNRPVEPEEVAEALNISVETSTRELEGMATFVWSRFSDRQRKVADLYNSGERSQAEVAEELGVSRATVARERPDATGLRGHGIPAGIRGRTTGAGWRA